MRADLSIGSGAEPAHPLPMTPQIRGRTERTDTMPETRSAASHRSTAMGSGEQMSTRVRVPCDTHRWHDLEERDAAAAIVALSGALVDAQLVDAQPAEDDDDDRYGPLACPAQVARHWARDSELYAELVEARLLGAGIIRDGEDGWEPVPRAERDPHPDGEPATADATPGEAR